MTQQYFNHAETQYYMPIVNDGVLYSDLMKELKSQRNFASFTSLVSQYMSRLRQRYSLHEILLKESVYVRLSVLRYMLSPGEISQRYGNDEEFCKLISFCHRNDMGWLASRVLGKKFPQPETQPQPKKENTMASIEIKTVTYINDADVTKLTDEQLIDSIKKLEAEYGALESVGTKSIKIEAKKAEIKDTLAKVVAILDAR